MKTHIIIPARYGSTRLPAKSLALIAGKPMIQHVYEKAQATKADRVIVATDHESIMEAVKKFGGEACLTDVAHRSGTERIAEVIDQLSIDKNDLIINVQGDEPAIPPSIIDQLITILQNKKDCLVATLCEPITRAEDIFNPNITHVLRNAEGMAIYFSRAPIPWYREGFNQEPKTLPPHFTYYRHLGIYGYRAHFVKQYITWQPSKIEQIESLEQLRLLWYGQPIYVEVAKEKSGPSVDTAADLEAAIKHIEKGCCNLNLGEQKRDNSP